jgi:hypothetical protein
MARVEGSTARLESVVYVPRPSVSSIRLSEGWQSQLYAGEPYVAETFQSRRRIRHGRAGRDGETGSFTYMPILGDGG